MKRQLLFLSVLIGFITTSVCGQDAAYKQYLLKERLPDSFRSIVLSEIGKQFEISDFINPFYLIGDYNGDEKKDIVVAVKEVKSGKTGFIVFHGADEKYLIGAGQKIGNGGDDFKWLDIWRTYNKDILKSGFWESKTVVLSGDAIYVAKAESASAVIYWTGTEYKWHQKGD